MADIISICGENFEIIKNPRRKKIAAGIDPYGKYFILCPPSYSTYKLKTIISDNMAKLFNDIEKKEAGKMVRPPHAYVTGEKFFFKGTEYDLAWTDDNSAEALELINGTFLIRKDRMGSEYQIFESWYKRSLYTELRNILPKWTKLIKVNPKSINIKTVKTIWGSCSAKGNITFCTRLALVPPDLLEYLAVHELCHMIHMNHSQRFWSEVEKYIPDHKERRKILKKNGQNYIWW